MAREDERYDDPDVRRSPPSGMDGFFLNTNMVVLVLFGFCCGIIALVIGIVGLAICKDPDAKQRALIVTIISGITTALGAVYNIMQFANNPALR
jgi:hypothetical protein